MKIGLLTYHHVINIGSILQTYCGYKLLQGMFPKAVVEIIDYVPKVSSAFNDGQRREVKGWKDQEAAYEKFLKGHCRFSGFSIRQDDVTAGMKALSGAGYDYVFVGSDTVFQVDGYLGRYIAGPAAPGLYYLPGPASFKKMGLAVSFDPPQEVPPGKKQEIMDCVKGFERIFYRDSHAEEALLALGASPEKLFHCPDPTIMVDIHPLCSPVTPEKTGGGGIGVSVDSSVVQKNVLAWLEKRGLKGRNLMHFRTEPSGFFGPKDSVSKRMEVYRGLDGLITDRFHGSILGMQLGDYPVMGVELEKHYKPRHGKLWDLFERLDGPGAVIRATEDGVEMPVLDAAWDAAKAHRKVHWEKMQSLRLKGIRNLTEGLNL